MVELEQMGSPVTDSNETKSNQLPSQLDKGFQFSDSAVDGQIIVEAGGERQHKGGWITVPFTFGCEAAEKLAMSGAHANLITYLVQQMHETNLSAASTLNIFSAVSMLTPLLGAFVADEYLGRFITIAIGTLVYLLGMVTLTLSALIKSLRPAKCTINDLNNEKCDHASIIQMGMVLLSFTVMALGSGGIRPCVAPFGASQFDQTHPKEKRQLNHYFHWYYFTVQFAELLATTMIVYIQENLGWGLGFGIPLVIMLISIAFFFGGARLYRYSPPRGSALTKMAQVVVAAVRKRKLVVPNDPSKLYMGPLVPTNKSYEGFEQPHFADKDHFKDDQVAQTLDGGEPSPNVTRDPLSFEHLHDQVATRSSFELCHRDSFKCLDKAAIEVETDAHYELSKDGKVVRARMNPWKLCTVQQVEELKCIVNLAPMWATVVVAAIALAQQGTYTVQQARSMDRHLGSFVVPPASLHTISIVTILLWLPFYDKVVVPYLSKFTKNERGITFLQEIAVGFVLLLVAMMVATLVEHRRRAAARHFGLAGRPYAVIPISVFWLVPQFVLQGLYASFSMVGHIEFFYFMVPEHMTSTGSALFMTSIAVGASLSSGLLHLVQKVTSTHGHHGWLNNNINKARLDYFYAFLTFLLFLDFWFYLIVARWYSKQKNINEKMVDPVPHPSQHGLTRPPP